MKFNLYKSVAACALLALTGCHDFEEMNTNPYEPVYDPSVIDAKADGIDIDYKISESALQSLKATESACGSTFQNFLLDGMYNDFQRTTVLTHDDYAAYWSNTTFVTSSVTYAYNDDLSGARWRHFYDDRTIGEYSQLIKTFWFCGKERYHTAFYITRIYYAFLMSAQTDTYGDIPMKYYVKGAVPPEENVKYSSQKEVYQMIFDILNQAVTQLQDANIPAAEQYNLGDFDKVYGGDKDKWIRFANTLRLRLALRVSNVDKDMAEKQAKAALNPNNGGLINQYNTENMVQVQKISYLGSGGDGEKNMYTVIFGWGAQILLSKPMEWAYKNEALKDNITPSEANGFVKEGNQWFNENEANCYLDPRCNKLWFRPSPWKDINGDNEINESDKPFTGLRTGTTNLGNSVTDYTELYSPGRTYAKNLTTELLDDYWWTPAREIVWLGSAEMCFLKAEACLRGYLSDNAETWYENGIKASMSYYNIPSNEYSTYLNVVKTKYNQCTNNEARLERIATQKWIAVFPNGNEGWAELRRTDYPRYILTPAEGNNSNGEIPSTKLIKRIQYPNSESRNPNKPGLDKVNQGTKVWWDYADTMDDNGHWDQPNNFR